MEGRTRRKASKRNQTTKFLLWSDKTKMYRNSMMLPPWVAVGNTLSGKTTLLDRMTLQLNKSRFISIIDYDIAILVLDITIDLQPETIQSINLLQIWNTRFIVALNHLDKIPEWETCPNSEFSQSYKIQNYVVKRRFNVRVRTVVNIFILFLFLLKSDWGNPAVFVIKMLNFIFFSFIARLLLSSKI